MTVDDLLGIFIIINCKPEVSVQRRRSMVDLDVTRFLLFE